MRIENLYSKPHISAFMQSGTAPGFADAESGVLLARQLTAIDPKILEAKYPELIFVNSGISVDNSGGAAEHIQTLRTADQGGFKNVKDKSGAKGIISLTAEDSLIGVIERAATSEWTSTQIAQANLANRNLPTEYIRAHNKKYMQEIDLIGLLGNPDIATSFGLLNYGGFTAVAAAGAIGTLTGQQMYDEFSAAMNAQHNAVNNTPEYMGTRWDMPVYVLNALNTKMLNTAADSKTVLAALKSNYPGISFNGTFRASDAGGAGVSHSVFYNNSDDAMKMRIPQPLVLGEVIKPSSFKFTFDSMYRIAGLDVFEDSAGYIVTDL